MRLAVMLKTLADYCCEISECWMRLTAENLKMELAFLHFEPVVFHSNRFDLDAMLLEQVSKVVLLELERVIADVNFVLGPAEST
jgi:hypothetical protein